MKRTKAAIAEKRPEMDWIVVRNRTGYTEARNMARIERALKEMSKRVGFRVVHGLSERVIYRELFPSGLTLLDKSRRFSRGTMRLEAKNPPVSIPIRLATKSGSFGSALRTAMPRLPSDANRSTSLSQRA